MDKRILFLTLVITFGCAENKIKPMENNSEPQVVNSESLPRFSTVREVLENANDFHEENGTLKFISEDRDNLHVQVSKPILKEDQESIKNEIVKRDIIYVCFQSFAQTDIDAITITAIPIDFKNSNIYYDNYKSTIRIDRNKAKSVLKKFLNTEDFSVLYQKQHSMWLPSKKFDDLKFDHLDLVYADLVNQ